MNWYYVAAGQQAGPVNEEQLVELHRSGSIADDTLVWREGMKDWLPYAQVRPGTPAAALPPDSFAAAPDRPAAVCAECGKMYAIDDMIRHGASYICANCKPIFLQKLGEGVKIDKGSLNYAGFWIRFAAKFVDGIILGVPLFAILLLIILRSAQRTRLGEPDLLMPLAQLIFIGINMAYNVFFIGRYGATPGKMVCKLKVVTGDGGRVTYPRAIGRVFAEMLSGMICYIGYIMAGFDSQKRSLHDHICNTRVVYK